MTDPVRAPFRLAFRVEGQWWVAYYAHTDSMHEAVELGRLRMQLTRLPETADDFKRLMITAIEQLLRDTSGLEVEAFEEETAPEHERAGSA